MQKSPFRRYTIALLTAVTALLAVAVSLAVAVDPYNYFHGQRWTGINIKKPAAYAHAAWAKQQLARRASPRAVILGNSRMDIGLDPQSPAWPDDVRPVFNLAIPGQGLSGDLKNLQDVFASDPPRLAVIGIDFLDFLYAGSGSEAPVEGPKPLTALERLDRITLTAMSLTAVSDSLATLRQQGNANAENMTEQGFNPFRQYLTYVQQEGHYAIFLQRNLENLETYLRKPGSVIGPTGAPSPSFEDLASLLRWAADREVQVKLVIYPYHVDILEGFRRTGLWPAFEDWKRRIVELVAAAARDGPAQAATLWDFSGYHAYATETVPVSGDTRTHMKWYWEAGHFKSALGDIMLRQMMKADDGSPGNASGHASGAAFGVRLTPLNVDAVIRRIRNEGDAYRIRHPNAGAHIQKIVDSLERR